ncbi:MAG: hypothetical protein NXH79_10860 [Rhodobacteraceae bacterium]|nr:hypothetical protein [Paracoccaceae bacterium]
MPFTPVARCGPKLVCATAGDTLSNSAQAATKRRMARDDMIFEIHQSCPAQALALLSPQFDLSTVFVVTPKGYGSLWLWKTGGKLGMWRQWGA